MSLALGLALVLMQQQPAVAPAPPSAKTAAAKDADPMVCHEEQNTGSLFPKRTCKHRSEWLAPSADADNLRDIQRQQNQHMSSH